jgi:DNA-binding response OmpR family regulator
LSVLIVEDDPDLTDVLAYMLRREGHEVYVAADGDTALQLWQENDPGLILLDVDIPERNGWDVCGEVRQGSRIPIIMLTGYTSDDDIVRGLELGADDYLTKPFSPRQLVARVRAVLRRAEINRGRGQDGQLALVDLRLDTQSHKLYREDETINLTKLEFELLYELAIHCGQVLNYNYIVTKVWGYSGWQDSSIIKGHVRNLRRKLGERPDGRQYIETVPGIGYVASR